MKKVFVVILHYKGKQLTRQCLLSLQKTKIGDFSFEVIVVDNHSPEPIGEFRKEFEKVIFLKNSQNLGFAEGNNVGIRKALQDGADYVFVVNNDTILDKNILIQLISAIGGSAAGGKVASLNDKQSLLLRNKTAILGPKIYFAPGYEYHKERYEKNERGKVFWYAGGLIDWHNILTSHRGVDEVDKGQYNKQIETDYVSGCAMFVKREVFEKIGLFNKRYFLYLEDVEFCQRAKKAGFKVVYTPKAKLWHANAGSSAVGGSLQDYYLTRNRMLFGIRYAPWRTKLALFKESIGLLFTGRRWQKAGIRDFYLRKFSKGSYEA